MKLLLFAAIILSLARHTSAATDSGKSPAPAVANVELEALYRADQADRMPADHKIINWLVVGPRDEQRRARVLEMIRAGQLNVGADYFHAAMVLQHGHEAADFLLCHELCVTAVFAHGSEQGDWLPSAKWLAAASEDRFLETIGRKQRFGTQFRTLAPDPTWHLGEIEDGVTDDMRKAWNCPPLAEAKKREAEMNR